MKDEYIIVNKTLILNTIEELIEALDIEANTHQQSYLHGQILALNSLVLPFNSISLIPEIEKAFDAGRFEPKKVNDYGSFGYKDKQDYIDNLNLEI